MKIKITQNNLNRALALLSRVASTRTPLPILSNILLSASDKTLELSATNLEVALTHTASGKIDEEGSVGTTSEDFPALPTITKGTELTLQSSDLKTALDRTMLAASNDETRPVLGGVYFHTEDGELSIAATDGYRLAESKISKINADVSAIIPSTTL